MIYYLVDFSSEEIETKKSHLGTYKFESTHELPRTQIREKLVDYLESMHPLKLIDILKVSEIDKSNFNSEIITITS